MSLHLLWETHFGFASGIDRGIYKFQFTWFYRDIWHCLGNTNQRLINPVTMVTVAPVIDMRQISQ